MSYKENCYTWYTRVAFFVFFLQTFAVNFKPNNTMDISTMLDEMQATIYLMQQKLDAMRLVDTTPVFEGEFMMTRKEAASFIGRSERQLDRLCKEYKIKKETVDGSVRIRKSSLLRFKGFIIEDEKPQSAFDALVNRYQ